MEFDPIAFGKLQAQVAHLVETDREKTELLRQMSREITTMREQMAEARGGWRMLLMLGGASAAVGGLLATILPQVFGKGHP